VIVFLTRSHTRYTHKAVGDALPFVKVMTYERVFHARSLPPATYVFTDFDRLGFYELELAADLFRLLERGGCRVLNDPARMFGRYALLHRLHAEGTNSFRAWRLDEGALPDRYPVFLRTIAAHRGALTSLLHNESEARTAADEAMGGGYPIGDLMFVEYCAEADADGMFWKHSVYRMGDALVPANSVLDETWQVKFGLKRLATDEQLRFEESVIADRQYDAALLPVFELAGVDYGRIDFAVVDGRPAIYEINTNPDVKLSLKAVSPIRKQTLRTVREAYLEAVPRLDRSYAGSPRIRVDSPRFALARSRNPFKRFMRTP
jgi:hypothetical protein